VRRAVSGCPNGCARHHIAGIGFRLLALFAVGRRDGETATDFFRRVDPERARAALADLERISEEEALPSDFVDLGEESAFKVETMAGECSV